jgi:predicted CXXCH cytochrome family protein
MLFGQCSRHTGNSLLTFFFDGVPEVDSTALAFQDTTSVPGDSITQALGLPNSGSPGMLVHYPYEERECAACHDPNSLGSMLEPQPDLCYMCHEDFSRSYTYLHGPVAGGYCTSCHNPHLSEKEHLLRFTGEKLCYHCHRKERVLKSEMHADLDGMECIDCHNAHGGEDNYIFQ